MSYDINICQMTLLIVSKAMIMDIKVYEDATKSTQKFVRSTQAWVIISSFVTLSKSSAFKVKVKGTEFKKGIITYGQLNALMKRDPFPWNIRVGAELGMIGEFCLQSSIPLLNTVVVNKDSGEPSVEHDHLLFSGGRKSFKAEQKAVLDFDWFSIRSPTPRQFRKAYETRND